MEQMNKSKIFSRWKISKRRKKILLSSTIRHPFYRQILNRPRNNFSNLPEFWTLQIYRMLASSDVLVLWRSGLFSPRNLWVVSLNFYFWIHSVSFKGTLPPRCSWRDYSRDERDKYRMESASAINERYR